MVGIGDGRWVTIAVGLALTLTMVVGPIGRTREWFNDDLDPLWIEEVMNPTRSLHDFLGGSYGDD